MTKASEPVKLNLDEIEARAESLKAGGYDGEQVSVPLNTVKLLEYARTDIPAMTAWIRDVQRMLELFLVCSNNAGDREAIASPLDRLETKP